jgi:VWFA-related protein
MRAFRLTSLYLILCGGALPALAQRAITTPAPSPTPLEATQDDVIRVRTNLVQVDAVVTDKDGHQVKDLSASDFEILENGQVRQADYCSYVSLVEQRPAGTSPSVPTPGTLTARDLRRTFIFIVANPVIEIGITMSTRGTLRTFHVSWAKNASLADQEAAKLLRWFVDEKMGTNDLAAISSTEVDLGVLASFTSDKQVLHAATEQVRNGMMHQSVPPVFIYYQIDAASVTRYTYDLQPLIERNLSVIGTAGSALDQVETLPGRKFLILVSRGMLYDPRLPGSDLIRARLDQLIARANRAHVTFYTLSTSAIGNYGGSGSDGLSAAGLRGMEDIDSLVHLANETGGRAIYNTNDIRVGFANILEENQGYYLLAYNPGAEATGRPHRIQVRVKHPGLHLRARAEAYSQAANDDRKTITAADTFNTPLAVRDIEVTLSPAESGTGSNRIVTTLAVGLSDLEARSKDGDGQVFSLEILVRIVGPDGRVVKENGGNINFKMNAANLETALREGLVSQFEFEAAKAGFYRISVGVRDTVSGRVGSATRFVEVPAARASK